MNHSCPTIYLNYTDKSLVPYACQIGYGIEEEGLFSIACPSESGSLWDAVYACARASATEIAVGISFKQIFIVHRRTGPHVFIAQKDLPSLTQEEGRIFGKNAARLVKGLPLYPMK